MTQSSERGRVPRIGLALGGGSARGWAHIGVLRELAAQGIRPDVIAGTSIGAVVGACHAAGKLDALEAFARGLNRRRMLQLLDLSLSGSGLIAGARLKRRLDTDLAGIAIEALGTTFAAWATELGSGDEVCLNRGDLVEAIRASYALPGIFPPVRIDGRWLIDGAMSNPVPISVARGLGADFVIAVNLTSGARDLAEAIALEDDPTIVELDALAEAITVAAPGTRPDGPLPKKRRLAGLRRRLFRRRAGGAPGMASVTVGAFSIAQERISRSRMAIDPPDAVIYARLDDVGLFDFHRAADLIAHGRLAARRAIPQIEAQLAQAHEAAPPHNEGGR